MSQEDKNQQENKSPSQPETEKNEQKVYGIFDGEKAEPVRESEPESKPEDKKSEFEAAQAAQRELEQARKALREQQERAKVAEDSLGAYQIKAKEDPKNFLKSLGMDAMELAEKLVAEDEPVQKPAREVEALMQKVAQLEQQIQMREVKEVEARQISEFASLLSPEKTPWLMALKEESGEPVEQQLVRAAVIRYQQTGEVPDYQAMIEEAEAKVKAKYEKLVTRFAPKPASQSKPAKTLTNQLTDEPTPFNISDMGDLDREERFKKIMREAGWK